MIKECEFLQHWRLGWSKVPELSLSFGELFSPDGGVVRPWGLGPKLDQTLETWGLLDVHTTFDDEICLSGTRSGQGSTLWALLGGGKSDFGQRNGLKPDPQTVNGRLREAVRLFEKKGAVAVSESGGLKRNAPFLLFPFKKQKSGEKD